MRIEKDVYENIDFQTIHSRIKIERQTYKYKFPYYLKVHSLAAMLFSYAGYASLIAAAFSYADITIFHATCLLIIGYIIEPTDGDRYEEMVKGIAEDLGNVRALVEFQNSNILQERSEGKS